MLEVVNDAFATLKPCSVRLERLSDSYVQDVVERRILFETKSGKQNNRKKTPKRFYTKTRLKNGESKPKKRKYQMDGSTDSDSWSGDSDEDEGNWEETFMSRKRQRLYRKEEEEAEEFEEYELELPKCSSTMFQCKKCAFVTNTKEHLLLHTSFHSKNICYICKQKFNTHAECEAHISESHTPVVEKVITFGCRKCKQYYTSETEFKNHLASHVGPLEPECISSEKPMCPFCRNSFAKQANLYNHLYRAHVEYKCTFCDTIAPRFEHLERHCQTLHSLFGRPFECEFCDFKFAVFGCLTNHRKDLHGVEWYNGQDRCRFCNILLEDKNSIIQHLAKHLGIWLFKCLMCEYRTNSRKEMEDHSRSEHNILEWFASEVDANEFMESVRNLIKRTFNDSKITETKKARTKPTSTETKEAVAAILESEEMSVILEPTEEFPPTLELGDVNNIIDVSDSISVSDVSRVTADETAKVQLKSEAPTDVKNLPKREAKKKTKGKKTKKSRVNNKVVSSEKMNGITHDDSNTDTDCTEIYDSESENQPEKQSKAVMIVDPVTGRLFVDVYITGKGIFKGINVQDENGYDLYFGNSI